MTMAMDPFASAPAEPIEGMEPVEGEATESAVKPPAYDNIERQIEIFKQVREQALEGRSIYERGWWRILMYLLKRQWIYFDGKRNQWRDKRLAKWMPRPTSSKMNEAQQTLRSTFASVELSAVVRPNGNDPVNVTMAEVADGLEPVIREEHQFDAVTRDQDFWLTALGNVVLHPWWDSEDGNIVMMPAGQCMECGLTLPAGTVDFNEPACPSCLELTGTPGMIQPVEGSDSPVPHGHGRTDVCSPLEILIPSGYQNWDDVRELIRVRWRTKSYYEANYPHLVGRIEWTKAPQERSIQLLKALATQSDLSANAFGGGGDVGSGESEGVVEYEMWLKPTQEFPEGYVGRFVGEGGDPLVIEDPEQSLPGPIPYRDIYNKPKWHWVHLGYDTFGGRLWSRSPMEDLIPLIDKINRLDARIELIVDRMSNPIWLEPKGAEVERLSGEPGIIVRYNALGANQGKPERVEGANIPASLFQLRQQYLLDIEAAVGTYDALKGDRPPNVEAFSAMQLLVEQGQRRFTMVFKERGRAYRDWFGLSLEMERDFGPEERIKATQGPNRTWAFDVFRKADLTGSVTVLVEDGSTTPKTALGKRAAIDHANQLQMINPTDPDQSYAIMSHLGLKDLIPAMDKSISSALREQHLYEQWVAGGRAEGVNPLNRIDMVDDDPVHIAQHRMWAMGDAIRDLMMSDPQALQEILMHIFTHKQGMMMQMMEQAVGAESDSVVLGSGEPPPPPGMPGEGGPGGESAPGGGQAMRSSNEESSGGPAMGRAA